MVLGLTRAARSRFAFFAILTLCVTELRLTPAIGNAAERHYLYQSTDHGSSWIQVGRGLPADARINALVAVDNVVITGTDQGLFRSSDRGLTWQASRKGPGTESRALCLAQQAGRLFGGTSRHGVLVSDDAGQTWRSANTGLADVKIRSLLVVGKTIYAGTDSQGVFASGDSGASWTPQRTGLPESAQIFDLVSLDGTIFAALYSQGLFRWIIDERRWEKAGDVRPLTLAVVGKTLLAGHNPGGIWASEDGGKTWSPRSAGLPVHAPIWMQAVDGGRALVGTSGPVGLDSREVGLLVSQDQGRSWIRSDSGISPIGGAVSFLVTPQYILTGIVGKESANDPLHSLIALPASP